MDKSKESERVRPRVEVRAVSMYPDDWQVVTRVAQRLDGNESLALRSIIREWNSGKDGGSDGSESDNK